MKVYQLIFGHHSYEEGYVTTPGRIYLNKEDAEAAKKWLDSIPDDPCAPYSTEVTISEIEVEETFTPWISVERIAAMQEENDEYYEYLEAMYGTDWDIPEEEEF